MKNNTSKIKMIREISESNDSLESKLLQYYIIAEIIWSLFNGVAALITGLPQKTILTYFILFFSMILFFITQRISPIKNIARHIFFVAFLFTVPMAWYMTGGGRTSANILFVGECILFVMCLRGAKQKIFVVLSLLSVPITQNVSQRLPDPVLPMDPRQYSLTGTFLGLTTTILFTYILLKQKQEYAKERDSAIFSEMELERSNKLQKNFLANMSHEIRSPLGIVMGFNNLVRESSDLEQIHEYANNISHAGSTLLTVINDILDYSKIESGKLDIINDDYSFKTLAKDIEQDLDFRCSTKGLSYKCIIDTAIPDNLYGDNIRIKQVLINLISNAVKYTEKGEVIFEARSLDHTDNQYKLAFIVKDTGKGISDEELPKLYSAFKRLDENTNRGIEGTGLGLAITKNLLEEMGGTIEVESELGKGSTFTVKLIQEIGKSEPEEIPATAYQSIEGLTALVVDDTHLNLTLVKKLLTKDGVEVTAIDNGPDCLEDLKTNKYDIILLDHMMPEMNGVDVFKKLKEMGGINEETPIVMLTANAMAGAMKEYLDMGFDGYLSKPIAHNELKETIYRLTHK